MSDPDDDPKISLSPLPSLWPARLAIVDIVGAPTITGFSAAKSPITAGTATTLTAVFSGDSGHVDNGLGLVATGIPIPTGNLATTTTFTLTVTNAAGGSASAQVTVEVVAAPSIASFTAAKSPITAGTATNLTAVFSGGAGSVDNGLGAVVTGVPIHTGNLMATKTYTLTVTNAAGTSAVFQTTVAVVAAPDAQIIAQAIATEGDGGLLAMVADQAGSTYAWTIINGTITAGSGTRTITFTAGAAGTLTLQCAVTNAGGSTDSKSAKVEVLAVPSIGAFTATPAEISAGGSSTLAFTFANGTGAINQDLGAVNSGGNVIVSPASTMTYTLTVTNAAGTSVTASATVTVVGGPSITRFAATPSIITTGGSSTLEFTFSNGTGTIDPSIGSVNSGGSKAITPSVTTTYTLTVTNPLGATITSTATVTVVPPPSITSFTASATQFYVNQGSTITANFSNGTGVVNPGGLSITSGTGLHVTPGMATRYVLTVTNAAGTSVSANLTLRPGIALGSGPLASHCLVLNSNGTAWSWGHNFIGQLGDGAKADRSTPRQILGLSEGVALAGGNLHSLALKSDGSVWAWGWNAVGQLGDGTTTDRFAPTPLPGLTEVSALAAGGLQSLALKSDGTVWAWGVNGQGQLGDGTTTNRPAPVQVSGLSDVAVKKFRGLAGRPGRLLGIFPRPYLAASAQCSP